MSTDLRHRIANLLTQNPTASDRSLAELLDCDHKTVGSVRKELAGDQTALCNRFQIACFQVRRVRDYVPANQAWFLASRAIAALREVWPRLDEEARKRALGKIEEVTK